MTKPLEPQQNQFKPPGLPLVLLSALAGTIIIGVLLGAIFDVTTGSVAALAVFVVGLLVNPVFWLAVTNKREQLRVPEDHADDAPRR